nr:kinetochore protein Spc25-like isoform X2 [Dermacentor andersoni]
MHVMEAFCNKVEQARSNTRQIAQNFKAALHKRQSIVLELHDNLETSKRERRRYSKAIEDGFEDIVELMRRYQLMMEKKKRDTEQLAALAAICDEKQKRLELHTLGRGYRICLTLLDPRQPQRCCSLLLGLDSEGKYRVSECEPTLASLDGLLKELRRTCNLLQFVRHVRQQFKNLLLAHPVEPSDEPAQIVDEHQEAVAKLLIAGFFSTAATYEITSASLTLHLTYFVAVLLNIQVPYLLVSFLVLFLHCESVFPVQISEHSLSTFAFFCIPQSFLVISFTLCFLLDTLRHLAAVLQSLCMVHMRIYIYLDKIV